MLGIWRQGSQLWANLERRCPLCIKPDMGIPYSVFEEGTLMWEVRAREKQHRWRGPSTPKEQREGRQLCPAEACPMPRSLWQGPWVLSMMMKLAAASAATQLSLP